MGYYHSSKPRHLKYKLREILNSFDRMIQDPKSLKLKENFVESITRYIKEYHLTFKLTYAIESIDRRRKQVSEENLKQQLDSIKQGMEEIKTFHLTASEIVFPLNEFAKKLLTTGLKQDLAKEILNLILKLKEFNFGEEGPNQDRPVSLKILDLIEDIKQIGRTNASIESFSFDKNTMKMYARNGGMVQQVFVKQGEQVWPGKALFKIRSDTFIFIHARDKGVVKRIHVTRGDTFVKNQLLIETDVGDSFEEKDTLQGVKEYVEPNSSIEYSKNERENSSKEKRHSRDSVPKPVETNENVYRQDSKKRKTSIAAQELSKSSKDIEEGEIIEF